MDYFDCIFCGVFYCRLNGRFSLPDTTVLARFMISLFPWLYFLQHLHQEYEGQETLSLIKLGFLRVVFPGEGEGQFDPPSYFKKNLSNINITLYNC